MTESDITTSTARGVFVTDFDGTITGRDFYRLVIDHLSPPGADRYWREYLSGAIAHFDALRLTYEAASEGEPALRELVGLMEPDPEFAAEVRELADAGWRVVIASAGCAWYIDQVLGGSGVEVESHANPGQIIEGRLIMERPTGSRHYSDETGVDKVGVVRAALETGLEVAFAGDGRTDLDAALLVPPQLRFARADLAKALEKVGEPFRPFRRWSEVSRAIRSDRSE